MTAPAPVDHCPHCGGALRRAADPAPKIGEAVGYDLEQLAILAKSEKAYDETVKIRVTQQDIRTLVERRRKRR